MHELAIAESILESVHQVARRRGLAKVERVGVRIGRLSGVLPDALQFCFGAIVSDTPDSGMRLEIEEVPVRVECRSCSAESEIDDWTFMCSACGATDVEVKTGMDASIAWLDATGNDHGPTETPVNH